MNRLNYSSIIWSHDSSRVIRSCDIKGTITTCHRMNDTVATSCCLGSIPSKARSVVYSWRVANPGSDPDPFSGRRPSRHPSSVWSSVCWSDTDRKRTACSVDYPDTSPRCTPVPDLAPYPVDLCQQQSDPETCQIRIDLDPLKRSSGNTEARRRLSLSGTIRLRDTGLTYNPPDLGTFHLRCWGIKTCIRRNSG